MIDLLVAGGGPVGLVTALLARRAGLSVTVLEPRAGALEKACGEGVMPRGVRLLHELGVEAGGMPLRGIAYRQDDHCVTADFARGAGRGVERRALSAALQARVVDAGVDVVAARVTTIVQTETHVDTAGLRARYLIGADGLHSTVRGHVDPVASPAPRRRWGLRAHYAMAPWTDRVEVWWSPAGEAYVTPLAPDRIGVALLTSSRAPFAEQLSSFSELRSTLADAEMDRPRGAGPLRQRVRRLTSGRVLLVGDAAGYVDAITGEGLAAGFLQAQHAIRCILDDRADDYDRAARDATRTARALTAGLLAAAQQRQVRRWVVPSAAACPSAFGVVVRTLGG